MQALAAASRFRPDLVITDLRMDQMDGIGLLKELQNRWPGLKVIILTAHGTIPDAVQATQMGAFGFLTSRSTSRSCSTRCRKPCASPVRRCAYDLARRDPASKLRNWRCAGLSAPGRATPACRPLRQEPERTHLRRLDRIGDRAVRGEDDHLEPGPAILQLLQKSDTVHLVHAQVGDDEIGTEAARGRQRLHPALNRLDVVALRAQADRQQPQQPRVIVDHEYARFAFSGLVQVVVLRSGCNMLAGVVTVVVLRCWVCARSASARCWQWHRASRAPPRAPCVNAHSRRSRVAGGGSRLQGAPGRRGRRQSAACDFLPPASNGRQFAAVPAGRARARRP